MNPFLKVFLRSPAGEVELSTHDNTAPFKLLDGTRGLGLPERSIESSPIPAGNGSALRSQRFNETEGYLPVSIKGPDASTVAENQRRLEHVLQVASDEPVELVVEAPHLGTIRRRYVYYLEGLEGAIGGSDSHFTWRHIPLKVLALDPMWYGREREIIQTVDAVRKPFITSAGATTAVPFFPVIIASSTVQGAYEFNISGDAEAWPIWDVHGPGEDLLIQNETTGENIFINGEFTEPVTVDARPTVSDIYSGDLVDGQLWERVDDDYSLFPLSPGMNKIKITMVNARPGSHVRLRYSETWLAGW